MGKFKDIAIQKKMNELLDRTDKEIRLTSPYRDAKLREEELKYRKDIFLSEVERLLRPFGTRRK